MRHLIALVFLFLAPMAAACPDAPDHSAALNDLLQRIQRAPNEYQARRISNEMWALWADAPDEAAQAVLDRGMGKRRSFDLIGALEDFDRLIAYCPDYAEGYNQRAFVRFLQQDYDSALIDLDHALKLSPTHVAALAGKALTLIGLGRDEEGQAVLRLALSLNPWLPERNLLQAPKGEEL
ncbi:tetratricopeptide repeat protein [Thalassovita sp.]|uniref:tetratricopeptide repeat protein n=1 Tax=Thalassovita sp. TaxID=1979401 RepID=UPI002B269DDE|nr:tetratricopeptide repeat protein [Thalassovita sp.]